MARRKKVTEVGLPPLPKEVWTPLGMVEVLEVEGLADSSTAETLCGQWDNGARQIRIRQGLQPVAAWQTLAHELMHAILHDAGASLPDRQLEAVCDAFGSFMAAFVLAGAPFPFGE